MQKYITRVVDYIHLVVHILNTGGRLNVRFIDPVNSSQSAVMEYFIKIVAWNGREFVTKRVYHKVLKGRTT